LTVDSITDFNLEKPFKKRQTIFVIYVIRKEQRVQFGLSLPLMQQLVYFQDTVQWDERQ